MPVRLGPISIAGNMIKPVIFEMLPSRKRVGAATAKAPAQEMTKVAAK
jgi:hypothetical protein